MQIKVKKAGDVNCANIFGRKKLKQKRVWPPKRHSSMADFRDVVLPAVRLIKASRIFVAVEKLIDHEKSRSLSWLFDCHRSRARNIKEELWLLVN